MNNYEGFQFRIKLQEKLDSQKNPSEIERSHEEMVLHHLMSLRLYDLYEKLCNYYMQNYLESSYD
jgi:hypothetical protein